MEGRFGLAICCIDGRIQEPVASWLKEKYLLDYVDMVTEAGADRVLAEGPPEIQCALAGRSGASRSRATAPA